MTDQLELDWLNDERPAPLPLDATTTARVRAELLSGDTSTGTIASRLRMPRRSRPRVLRIGLSGGVLGACAVVALLATGSGGAGPVAGLPSLAVQSASAKQQLHHLSIKLAADTAPIGDATLVLRTQQYANSPSTTGADLYADNGNYYYATALSGLSAAITANRTVNTSTSDQEVRAIAAAKGALTEPIGSAREQMSTANLAPGVKPLSDSQILALFAEKNPAMTAALGGARFEQILANDATRDITSGMTEENSMIWDNSMDALVAGAGNPQVRAGVLKLLATIPQIQVTQSTLNGQPTLVLSAELFSSKSGTDQEQIILNANSGVPEQMLDGNVGQTPSLTTDYTISRVTVSSIENGTYSG